MNDEQKAVEQSDRAAPLCIIQTHYPPSREKTNKQKAAGTPLDAVISIRDCAYVNEESSVVSSSITQKNSK